MLSSCPPIISSMCSAIDDVPTVTSFRFQITLPLPYNCQSLARAGSDRRLSLSDAECVAVTDRKRVFPADGPPTTTTFVIAIDRTRHRIDAIDALGMLKSCQNIARVNSDLPNGTKTPSLSPTSVADALLMLIAIASRGLSTNSFLGRVEHVASNCRDMKYVQSATSCV